jgi:internalin A
MTIRKADDLMADTGLEDPATRQLVRAVLHDRGEILHFQHDPELAERVVLQPAWIDSMITKVLDSQQVADRGGLLSRAHRAHCGRPWTIRAWKRC